MPLATLDSSIIKSTTINYSNINNNNNNISIWYPLRTISINPSPSPILSPIIPTHLPIWVCINTPNNNNNNYINVNQWTPTTNPHTMSPHTMSPHSCSATTLTP